MFYYVKMNGKKVCTVLADSHRIINGYLELLDKNGKIMLYFDNHYIKYDLKDNIIFLSEV